MTAYFFCFVKSRDDDDAVKCHSKKITKRIYLHTSPCDRSTHKTLCASVVTMYRIHNKHFLNTMFLFEKKKSKNIAIHISLQTAILKFYKNDFITHNIFFFGDFFSFIFGEKNYVMYILFNIYGIVEKFFQESEEKPHISLSNLKKNIFFYSICFCSYQFF